MDVEKVKSQLHSLAFGQAMAAAATDYKKVGVYVIDTNKMLL